MRTTLAFLVQMAAIGLLYVQPVRAAVVFTAGTEEVLVGGDVSVPVSASGFTDVSAFQFTLAWDSGVLTLQAPPIIVGGVLSSGTSTHGTPGAGILTFVWDTGTALTLDPNTTIFTVEFTAVGAEGTSTLLSFTDNPTERLVTFSDTTEGTIGNGLMFTVNGGVGVVPEPVNYALGLFAVLLTSTAGVRWIANRRRLSSPQVRAGSSHGCGQSHSTRTR